MVQLRVLSLIGAMLGAAAVGSLDLGVSAQTPQLPLQPARDNGQSITGAFEGWYQNQDGSYTLLVGYFNRNVKQLVDIPVGPNNRIEPGGPDYGQPTYFESRRQWGVFAIKVPKDFGDKRLTWTITANGQTTSLPIGVIKDYQIEPFKEVAQGNQPPKIQFDPKGPIFQGPPAAPGPSLTGTVGQPVTLDATVTDDAPSDPDLSPVQLKQPPIAISWHKFRGPGDIKFEKARPSVEKDGTTSTTATFSAPGEYILRAQVNDRSGEGGGGFQCCWTNVHVKVSITGGTSK
jgi:hypothetical protein